MNNVKELGSLKVEDLSKQAEPFLTEKTKEALSRKSLSQLHIVDGVVTHQCLYIGKKVKINEVELGIKFVVEKINDLGEKDLIHSCLINFIRFDLYPDTVKELECLVLCYVLVPIETYNLIMKEPKIYGAFAEGGIPK